MSSPLTLNSFVAAASAAALLFSSASFGKNNNLGSAPPPNTPTSIVLTPDTVRTQLLETSLSITEAMKKLNDSKDQVSVARGNLLPSVNLNMMISAASGFQLGNVQFLLPFLIPSNWFNYKAQKATFEADKISFRLLELNAYSSALSLYYTVLADRQIRDVYLQQAADLKKLSDIADQLVNLGMVDANDVLQFKVQANMAGVQASTLQQLSDQELAALRRALGLPFSTNITFEGNDLPVSQWEDSAIQAAIDQAVKVAPEHAQIGYLVKAADDKKWSTALGWINGATLSTQVGGSSSAGSGFSGGGNVNLGFALFPSIKIAARQVEEVKLMDVDLYQSNTQIMESAMKTLAEVKRQFALASQAEQGMKQVYRAKELDFKMGIADVTNLLVTRPQMTQSSVARIQAEMDMNLQRTVMHRALLTGPFAAIKGCGAKTAPDKSKKKFSLDDLCRGATP